MLLLLCFKTDVEQTHNRAEQGDNIIYLQKAGGLQLAMRVTLIFFPFFVNTGLFVCGESSGDTALFECKRLTLTHMRVNPISILATNECLATSTSWRHQLKCPEFFSEMCTPPKLQDSPAAQKFEEAIFYASKKSNPHTDVLAHSIEIYLVPHIGLICIPSILIFALLIVSAIACLATYTHVYIPRHHPTLLLSPISPALSYPPGLVPPIHLRADYGRDCVL